LTSTGRISARIANPPLTTAAINDALLPTEGMVTTVLPLADLKKGFDMMKKGEGSINIVLIP
jgi:Zn-dependent alcohol dehydrogenase